MPHHAEVAGEMIDLLSTSIAEHRKDWCRDDWHGDAEAVMKGPQKKRRLDIALLQQSLAKMRKGEAREVKTAEQGVNVDKDAVFRFQAKDLNELRCVCLDFCSGLRGQSLAVTVDAGRFRKPGKEYILAVLGDCKSERAFVGVPEVLSLFHVHQQQEENLVDRHPTEHQARREAALVPQIVWLVL